MNYLTINNKKNYDYLIKLNLIFILRLLSNHTLFYKNDSRKNINQNKIKIF